MPFNFRVSAAIALLALGSGRLQAAPPTIGGCQVFPANHYWNTPIDQLPVDTVNSTNWVNSIGANTKLHPDWGNVLADNYGIPFSAGPSPISATIDFDVPDESDPGPYRIPSNAQVEGGAGSGGDMHVLSIDTTACKLYELYSSTQTSENSWHASSGAIFDLNSNALRTAGFTSADASGLAIFPGLVRWEEVAAGEIAHAIRFTAPSIWGSLGGGLHKYIWPARHWSGNLSNPALPPMGARFRLKSSFNISTFSPTTQVILRAFKKYGMVLVDGGSSWYFQGVSDTNWPDSIFSELGNAARIKGSDFEVVNTSLLQIDVNSALAVQVPGAPANVIANPGNGQATFTFIAPPDGGSPIVASALYPAYKITCGAVSGTGTSSPITVSGLANGITHSCSISAANVTGVGPASAPVNVTPGVPVISLSSTSVNFGSVVLNDPSPVLHLTVSNTGSGDLSLSALTLGGSDAAEFVVSGGCSVATVLQPTQSCVIDVEILAVSTGLRVATLTVDSNAPVAAPIINLGYFGASRPDPPIAGNAIPGDGQATVFFMPPTNNGGLPIFGYRVFCDPNTIFATGTGSPILVTGLTNGIPYLCRVTAANTAGQSLTSANVSITPSATAQLVSTMVHSRKTHGIAGDFNWPLDFTQTINQLVSVEPRRIGSGHLIVFTFNNLIAGTGVATVTPVGTASAATVAGKEVRVTLSNVPDNQRITLALTGVTDLNASSANVSVSMGFLVGDVNGSHAVNASDISSVKAHAGQGVSTGNFHFDLNASGSISAQDVSLAKSRSGLAMP